MLNTNVALASAFFKLAINTRFIRETLINMTVDMTLYSHSVLSESVSFFSVNRSIYLQAHACHARKEGHCFSFPFFLKTESIFVFLFTL